MHTNESSIAKKYARAFLINACESVNDEMIEACYALSLFLQEHRYVYALLCMPTLSQSSKNEALNLLFKRFNIAVQLQQLCLLLLRQGRIDGIDLVLEAIRDEYYKERTIELFKIISSHPLTASQKQKLEQFVQTLAHHRIRAEFIVDPKLVVGLRVQSNSRLWERSIRKELLEIGTHIAQKGMS